MAVDFTYIKNVKFLLWKSNKYYTDKRTLFFTYV